MISIPNELAESRIALTLLPKVGPLTARRLVEYFGSEEQVLSASPKRLREVPGCGPAMVELFSCLNIGEIRQAAREELKFIKRNGLRAYFVQEEDYPPLLRECPDAPLVLYYRGDRPLPELYPRRWISIVGTRRMTAYGQEFIKELMADLRARGYNVLIVSGLAHGVDGAAHGQALAQGFPTVGVLGHGLQHFYPVKHKGLAKRMLAEGGLITEFPHARNADKGTFLQRNRVIAGLSLATIVVESAVKGGAMVTARRALDYQREVLALPGNAGRPTSSGCNQLIKRNIAALIENVEDLENALLWDPKGEKRGQRTESPALFYEANPTEQLIIDAVQRSEEIGFDELLREVKLPINQLNSLLLKLEFANVLQQLPGRRYRKK